MVRGPDHRQDVTGIGASRQPAPVFEIMNGQPGRRTKSVRVFVQGPAIPQPRHHVAPRQAKSGKIHIAKYIPKLKRKDPETGLIVKVEHPIHAWRKRVRECVQGVQEKSWPVKAPDPVWVQMEFTKVRPKSVPKSVLYWTTKPDRSNLEKAVEDAMEGVVFDNDSQIVGGPVTKRYADQSGVMLRISWNVPYIGRGEKTNARKDQGNPGVDRSEARRPGAEG